MDEKLDIIGNEFQIPLENDIRKDVSEMCNLSQGIEDRAYERGTANAHTKCKKIRSLIGSSLIYSLHSL